jgi:hypothetical protein
VLKKGVAGILAAVGDGGLCSGKGVLARRLVVTSGYFVRV